MIAIIMPQVPTFTQPLHHEWYATQSHFFKQSTAGLNSEFYFFNTDFLTKIKEARLPYYLLFGGNRWIHAFP